MTIRLHKYLAECGIASRRRCEELIRQGRIRVNGATAKPGDAVDPGVDIVLFNGEPVRRETQVHILLNKPRGVITSLRDPHHPRTVLDCLAGVSARVFPVGRLDMDVEGALLLTNDGELAYRLTHPRLQIEKVYVARVRGRMTPATAARLERGVKLQDGMTAPVRVAILNRERTSTVIEIRLHEGRKREIKRMCAHVGHEVLDLQRIAIGNINIHGLQVGQWRYLRKSEVAGLRKLTGLV